MERRRIELRQIRTPSVPTGNLRAPTRTIGNAGFRSTSQELELDREIGTMVLPLVRGHAELCNATESGANWEPPYGEKGRSEVQP